MLKVIHRVNTIDYLQQIPSSFGVEVDLRQWGEDLIAEHDAFVCGVEYEEWLNHFRHKFVILNIKSEGIEKRAVQMLVESHPQTSYFLLDQSMPFMIRSILEKTLVSCVRVSDLEDICQVEALNPPWVWLDCHFGDWSFLKSVLPKISELGIKTCLASPELHGRSVDVEMAQVKSILNDIKVELSAVCTKNPSNW